MRKILLLLIVISLTAGVVGCKKGDKGPTKEDYQNLATQYKGLYEEANNKIASLEIALASYGADMKELESLNNPVLMPDGSKVFLNINGVVHIGEQINLEPYNRVPNQSKVDINDMISFKPTKNWTMQFIEDGLIMQHTTGVYGEIVSYQYAGEYDGVNCYANMLLPYLEGLGFSDVEAKILFMGDARVGYTVELPIKAVGVESEESEDYIYNFGLTIASGKITVYKFFYEQTESNEALRELVNNTIRNISINGTPLTLE